MLPFCLSLTTHESMALFGTETLFLKAIDSTWFLVIGPLNARESGWVLLFLMDIKESYGKALSLSILMKPAYFLPWPLFWFSLVNL